MHGHSTMQLGTNPFLPLWEHPHIAELLAYLWPGLLLAVAAPAAYMIAFNYQHAFPEPVVLENILRRICKESSLPLPTQAPPAPPRDKLTI